MDLGPEKQQKWLEVLVKLQIQAMPFLILAKQVAGLESDFGGRTMMPEHHDLNVALTGC